MSFSAAKISSNGGLLLLREIKARNVSTNLKTLLRVKFPADYISYRYVLFDKMIAKIFQTKNRRKIKN
jgi:hypothetical protein